MLHTFNDETIEFKIVYKKRKTTGIYIDLYGNIEVRAPKELYIEDIIDIIEKKWDWIINKTKEIKERTGGNKGKIYEDGEMWLYLGKEYPIIIQNNDTCDKDNVFLKDMKLHVYVKEEGKENIKKALKRFYYQESKKIIEKRIKLYKNDFKTKYKSIRISDVKSNWGTCNSKYEMTFNWRLAMATIEAIDYVVVHEMCHMQHLNHDRSFWRLVGKIIPDYKERKEWLDNNSWKMNF